MFAFQITATDDICIVKDRTYRKLIIKNCKEDDAGKYRCEADGRKTEAVLKVEGTPKLFKTTLFLLLVSNGSLKRCIFLLSRSTKSECGGAHGV